MYKKGLERRSLALDEAIKLTEDKGTKFVWVGIEPSGKVRKVINLSKDKLLRMNPEELIYSTQKRLKSLENHVFVCYHGRTSKLLSDYLKNKHEIHTYHLEDGIKRFFKD